MKAAFSCWNERIAPVFDTARELMVVEQTDEDLSREILELNPMETSFRRALWIAEMGVLEIVCGAVSREYHQVLLSQGLKVIPFVSGDLDSVVTAWIEGRLPGDSFLMPGCGGGRRMGRGNSGGRRGKFGAGPVGRCVCPSCGKTQEHVPGVPCGEQKCSHCGAGMVREKQQYWQQ